MDLSISLIQSVMIRPSGTEPVLRTYAEAPTLEEVRKILKVTEAEICTL